ncbi:MAG: hypothetical protein AAF479_00355 [Pseudomonadota bacterium]
MSQPNQQEWSAGQLAGLLGISERHVKRLAADGVIPKVKRGRYGPEAVAAYCAYLRDTAGQGGTDFAKERARLTRAKAEGEELALAKLRGELINADDARREIFELARAERDAHLSWVSRIAPQLASAAGADPTRLFAALDRSMRHHLLELAEVDF